MGSRKERLTDADALPEYLKENGRFCLWRFQKRPGQKKPTKVPYNPKCPNEKAKSNLPDTFSDFETAKQVYSSGETFNGLGVGVFGNLAGIDIDHCIEHGQLSDMANDIVEKMNSYTEISPSGEGLRIFFLASDFDYDTTTYYIKNSKIGLEIYVAGITKRFLTVTGNTIGEGTIEEKGTELQQILDEYMNRPDRAEDERDRRIIQKAKAAANGEKFSALFSGDCDGYASRSEADLALCNLLAFWTQKDSEQMDRIFRKSGLMREKWDRSQSGTTYGAITLQKAIEACKEVYRPQRGKGSSKKHCIQRSEMTELLESLNITVRYNQIKGRIEICGLPEEFSKQEAVNTLPIYLKEIIPDYLPDVTASKQVIEDLLFVIADNNRYNPVRDMLESVVWDRMHRIEELGKLIGIDANSAYYVYLKKWLHQTVALALNDDTDPYGADGVLVLQGAQGLGKTSFFSVISMCSAWFAEGVSLDLRNKDAVIQSTGVWIAELGELDSTLKKEQVSLKSFLTMRSDTFRRPYARAATDNPRRTSFCATVNPDEFLRDETGSRRFWIIHVESIDVDRLYGLEKDWLLQMWREVYETLYMKDPQAFRLTKEERSHLESENRRYNRPIEGELEIRDHLNFDAPLDKWDYRSAKQLADEINIFSHAHVKPIIVGRILAKIRDEHPEIEVKNPQNTKQYLLPPMRATDDNSEENTQDDENDF